MPDDKKTTQSPPGLSLDGVPPEIHKEMIKLFRQNNMPSGPDEAEAAAVQMGDVAGSTLLGGLMGGEQQSPDTEQAPQGEQPQAPLQEGSIPLDSILKNVGTYDNRNSKDAQTFAGAVDSGDMRQREKAESSYWEDNAGNLTQIALAALLGTIGAATKNIALFPFAQAIGGSGRAGVRDWYREQNQEREARLEGLMSPQDTVKRGSQLWDESKNALQLNAHAQHPDDEVKRNQMIQEGLTSLYETMPDKFKEANPDAVSKTFQRMNVAGLGPTAQRALYEGGQADFGSKVMAENVRAARNTAKAELVKHFSSEAGKDMLESASRDGIDSEAVFDILEKKMGTSEDWLTLRATVMKDIPGMLAEVVEDLPREKQIAFDNKAKETMAKIFGMSLDDAKQSTGTITASEVKHFKFLTDAKAELVGTFRGDETLDKLATAFFDGLKLIKNPDGDGYVLGAQLYPGEWAHKQMFKATTKLDTAEAKKAMWEKFINSENPMEELTPKGQEVFKKMMEISD